MSRTCVTYYAAIVLIAKDELCQKWDFNPRPVNWTAILTQRLGPLGHPDSRNLTLTICNLYLGPNNLGLVQSRLSINAKDYANEDQRHEKLLGPTQRRS